MQTEIPSQKKMINAIENIPVEYFAWGNYPDHFKIEMPHRHEFAELLFFTDGGGTHEIDYSNHDIKSCSVHYVPKSTVHFLNRNKHSKGFTVSFDTDYFETNNTHKFLNPLNKDALVFNLELVNFSFIYNQTKNILHQIKQDKGYYQRKCFLLSMELLLNSISAEQNNFSANTKLQGENELVRNFKNKVQAFAYNHHNVSWYANELNVSCKHLGNQVKKHEGISAKYYIQETLLISIKKELLNSNKTLSQISYDHNYDASSLGKLFKKHVGITMNAYRSYNILE